MMDAITTQRSLYSWSMLVKKNMVASPLLNLSYDCPSGNEVHVTEKCMGKSFEI